MNPARLQHERAYLNSWSGEVHRQERRIDRARDQEVLRREVDLAADAVRDDELDRIYEDYLDGIRQSLPR